MRGELDHRRALSRLYATVLLGCFIAAGCSKAATTTSSLTAPNREQRIGAMLSVRGHVYLTDEQLHAVNLMPLQDAADVLARHRGDRALLARQRATAMLLAARAVKRAPFVGARLTEIDRALTTLEMTRDRLQALDADFVLHFPPETDLPRRDLAWFDAVYRGALARLFPDLFVTPMVSGCIPSPDPSPSAVPIGKWPVVLKTKTSVNIPVDQVARHIDPQRWDECSDFWNPPPNATRLMDWVSGQAVPKATPPSPGAAYPHSTLMQEKFKCGSLCGDANFDLLLCVTTRCTPTSNGDECSAPDSYASTYVLPLGDSGVCDCVGCPPPCAPDNKRWWLTKAKIGPDDVVPCMDEGSVRARKDPSDASRTIVEADKTLHFDPNKYSTNLSIIWSLLGHEMNDELGSLACCAKNP